MVLLQSIAAVVGRTAQHRIIGNGMQKRYDPRRQLENMMGTSSSRVQLGSFSILKGEGI